MDNHALLEDYLTKRSQEAFTELVKRHVALVYSTAWRITRESAAAEDVAQTVFIRLARLAPSLRDRHALPGWLYRTTCHVAYNALRAERRRRATETAAMQITETLHDSRQAWERLAPLLDEAMARLNLVDQNIVVQRFFEGRSLREVGAALGLSDDAAQKRVHRALEKLREYFAKNGVAVPAVVLVPALSEHAIHSAPAHVAPKISAAAYATGATGGGAALFKFLILMSEAKIKTGLTAAVIALLLGALGWSVWANIQASRDAAANPPEATPPPAAAREMASAHLPTTTAPMADRADGSASKISASPAEDMSLPGSMSLVDKMADKTLLANHAAHGRDMAIAFIEYANKNQGNLPLDVSAVRDQLGNDAENYPFKVIYQGSVNKVKKPEQTVMLREEPFLLSDGQWGRCYVYVDGHVASATSASGDFSAWESEYTDNLPNR